MRLIGRLAGVTTGGRRQMLAPPAAFLALLAAAPGLADAPADAAGRVATLVRDRLPGEYDNHEQVWQAGLDGATLPARRHLRIVRVSAPRLGTSTFVIDVVAGDGPADPAQRLLLVLGAAGAAPVTGGLPATAWASDGSAIPDPQAAPAAFATLAARDLRRLARCELAFTAGPDGDLDASPTGGGCRPARGRGDAPAAVPTDWRHDGETLWLATASAGRDAARRAAVPAGALRYRRAQHYVGWAAVKPGGPASTGGDDTYRFMPGLTVHNEGQVVPILDPEGRRTGYAFQLARLTYQNTRTPILKLGLIDEATGATLVYSWAEPGAERIGINVRWAQVGLTRKPGAPSFAVDPPALPP